MAAPTIDDVRLDPDIGYGSVASPVFATKVVVTGAGAEQRIGLWSGARRRYVATLEDKTPTQLADLLAFWYARQGRLRAFRWKDWADYSTGATKYNLTELSATTFQLVKTYSSGGQTLTRNIYLPVSGTTRIYNGGTEITSGWTVSTTTGIVTFSVDPPYTPSATFEFDVPVRFDMDGPQFVSHNPNQFSWEELAVVELIS